MKHTISQLLWQAGWGCLWWLKTVWRAYSNIPGHYANGFVEWKMQICLKFLYIIRVLFVNDWESQNHQRGTSSQHLDRDSVVVHRSYTISSKTGCSDYRSGQPPPSTEQVAVCVNQRAIVSLKIFLFQNICCFIICSIDILLVDLLQLFVLYTVCTTTSSHLFVLYYQIFVTVA